VDIKTKALEAIEGLCSLDENSRDVVIYKIAHVALGKCENPHDDWREELDRLHKLLVKNKVI